MPRTHFTDERVLLTGLLGDQPVLSGFVFSRCEVHGPAVVLPEGGTRFVECHWLTPDPDALFFELPDDRETLVGVISLHACRFEACTFNGVAIAGPTQLVERFRAELGDI